MDTTDIHAERNWEHVHRCPQCEHIIKADEIPHSAIATGVITCPKCDFSGQSTCRSFQTSALITAVQNTWSGWKNGRRKACFKQRSYWRTAERRFPTTDR